MTGTPNAHAAVARPRGTLTTSGALLYGGLTVGVLDILDAVIFFGARGAVPSRIFQSIAAGLLGRAAFQGGAATAALGLLLHFVIAFGIVGTFLTVARFVPALPRRPFLVGPIYGLLAYAVMTFVVLPLSAAASGTPSGAVLVNGLLIHAFGVGLPSALFARAAAARPAR